MRWRKKTPDSPGVRVWNVIDAFKHGRFSAEEAEVAEVFSTAKLLGAALQADPATGPEPESLTHLRAAIADDVVRRLPGSRPRWNAPLLPWTAAAGWGAAALFACLFMYQRGLSQGIQQANTAQFRQIVQAIRVRAPGLQQVAVASPITAPPAVTAPSLPVVEPHHLPPPAPVVAEPLEPPIQTPDRVATFEPAPPTPAMSDDYDRAVREAQTHALQREWPEAADDFERAAQTAADPKDAIESYHEAARIASAQLENPDRASTDYQREYDTAKRLLEQLSPSHSPAQEAEVRIEMMSALANKDMAKKKPTALEGVAKALQQSSGGMGR